jgi:hypothetical protein
MEATDFVNPMHTALSVILKQTSRVNRFISTYTYYMLFERQGWAKSTSKNVAKAYLDTQITSNISLYDLLCE